MNIFVVHASHRLTDHAAHGDGLIAWGFIKTMAERGHKLWVVAPCIDVQTRISGVELFEIPRRGSNRAAQLAGYAIRSRLLFRRLSRRVHFDVVHQMNPVVRGYALGLLGVRTPLVLGPYNGDWPKPTASGAFYKRAKRRIIGLARYFADVVTVWQGRAFLITTPNALERLPGLTMSASNIYMVPNGIDANMYHALGPSQSKETANLLMIGNAVHKGVFTMLDAFEKIAEAVPEAELTIAGGGPDVEEVRRRVSHSQFRDRYRLIGSVSREQMPAIIRAADILCVPSFGEPFGMVVIEGMASGKPVVGTEAGGIPYLLANDRSVLFPPGDANELARVVIGLLQNRERAKHIGIENRKRIVEEFTWQAVGAKLEGAYESALR